MNVAVFFRWFWRGIFLLGILIVIPYSWALILALLTAILLDGLVRMIGETAKLHRLWAVLISFVLYVGGLMSITYFSFSVLIKKIIVYSEEFPGFIREMYLTAILPVIRQWERYSQTLPPNLILSIEQTMEKGVKALEVFTEGFVQDMVQFVTLIPGFFIDFLIYLIALFLISLELPKLRKKAFLYLKISTYQKISLVYQDLSIAAVGFIKAQILLSLITFIMAYGGLWLLNVKYTIPLALLIVVVDILPILGTGSVLVPWAIIVWAQGNHHLGIGLVILFLVITIIRRTIEPKIYSANMGLSPLASLVSLYLGFKMLGFIGLFLGPSILIVYDTLKKTGVIKSNFKI
ncbi:sporulation integral membrane protein YtvI [Peribacillus sp. CSMR9]|uniref:sporulation integral membrane protein YtvI n=1 Tax=Peribacillus sp. CSMR9 TaxID=2981350 RepID=UPI0029532796|nr:sporulation integral membrane protein YtvI [Peribacillus sp. CSMR9]MDV7764087.1 sporulation integral membrane protein YtvI [Peribacillus sp. CSMR9]